MPAWATSVAAGAGMDDVSRLLAAIQRQSDSGMTDATLPELMTLVAQNAQNLTGAEGAAVQIVEGDELVAVVSTGCAAEHPQFRVPVTGSLSGLAVRSQEVQLCDDSQADQRVDRRTAQQLGARSLVTVPLFLRSEPVGVLTVMSALPAHFRTEHVDLLQVMAGLVASAISQARRRENPDRAVIHDPLTDLVSRAYLKEALSTALARWRREGGSIAVVVVDLDGFRPVNDEHGYAVGDTVLVEVSRRIRRAVRKSDVVARTGGDEFAVLCENRDMVSTSHLARRLSRQITMPVATSAGAVTVGVSIGAAVAVEDESADQLLSRADAAMYRTKRSRQRGLDLQNVSISGSSST